MVSKNVFLTLGKKLNFDSDPESDPEIPVKSDPDPKFPLKSDPEIIFADSTHWLNDLQMYCRRPEAHLHLLLYSNR